ncbi:MAG TPA: MaoC/PaaZ C-terminal domain-containing protein [Candidatus Binataceae bacterium]|nr:MaoC/PaaZ C-terminal domain-containing protein [Candidatus Binataceae bacterium]
MDRRTGFVKKSPIMALDSSLVGTKVGPVEAEIDARWMMAYAAALDDMADCYLDTRRPGGIVAHPLFPVCFEWPAAGTIRTKLRANMAEGEPARGVHATHHTILHRPLRPPMRLSTTAEVLGVERRAAGAFEVVKFATVDHRGTPVCTTYYGSLYRKVEVNGPDHPAELPRSLAPTTTPAQPRTAIPIAIGAGAAHIYTECARIWNPIHTDAAVAAAAGLPGLILHGTATLAMAVSAIVRAEAQGDPARVSEVGGRFGAMVLMPSVLTVRIQTREKCDRGDAIFFEALSADGGRAIRDGFVILATD